MTIELPNIPIAKSVWPKLFGGISLAAQMIAATYYSNVLAAPIFGLTPFAFWSMISGIATALALFVVRQDNKSSEQVGAGNVPIIPSVLSDTEKAAVKAQIDELNKKLEAK